MSAPQQTSFERALVWLRRDLRAHDHAALSEALRSARQVWCAFVYDRELLDPLPAQDRRVEFIHASVAALDQHLRALGAARGRPGVGLLVRHGLPVDEIAALAAALGAEAVYANHDDEPLALRRDAAVRQRLGGLGIALHTRKDHVVFERDEVLTQSGKPYSVFTPYKNAWLARLARGAGAAVAEHPVEPHTQRLAAVPAALAQALPTLAELGFAPTNLRALGVVPGTSGARARLADFATRIDRYDQSRDYPAVKGPSYLSAHLRFGCVSVRELVRAALERPSTGASVWLSELIWRDFYHQLLHHHPRVVGRCFRAEYDAIEWEAGAPATAAFGQWCEGRTGYPLVDAAMAQINQTGYMHNRLRMVVASFLTKDLGLDWRWGEAYFARQLLDFDLAANNGGWQWAASTGCDAQPYFRIFNPVAQSRKFDPHGKFIRRYLPALAALPDRWLHAPWEAPVQTLAAAGVVLERDYPQPIVDHATARLRTLRRFEAVKSAPAG
jgi:deoxyribodipyrimidine photo-lyase